MTGTAITVSPVRPPAIPPAASLAALAVLAACVTYDVEPASRSDVPVVARSLAIPLGGTGGGDPNRFALDSYYGSVISQMQDAVVERDPELLDALLAAHDREFAPDWARDRIVQFRRLVHALSFELHAERTAVLELVGETPALGEAVPLRLGLASSGGRWIAIPGVDGATPPARVLVAVVVVDHDCYGGRSRREFSEILTVADTVRFDDGDALDLRFGLAELTPEGCERLVDITCDLLPGNILLDGEALPSQRARLGSLSVQLFPRGIDSVRAHPYTHLKAGLQSGDPKHFDNVFLAARLMPDAFREDATARCIEQLRIGRPDVGRVAMSALRELTGEAISVENRDGWLAWWQARGAPR